MVESTNEFWSKLREESKLRKTQKTTEGSNTKTRRTKDKVFGKKLKTLPSGIHKSCTQWSPGSSSQETAIYQRGKSNC
jgi:hypothetical protein